MEIVVEIWKYWFIIGTVIFIFVLSIEISAIKGKINGANGFIWTMVNLMLAIATGILWVISIIFLELGTLFLYLFYAILYFVIEIIISGIIFNFYTSRNDTRH